MRRIVRICFVLCLLAAFLTTVYAAGDEPVLLTSEAPEDKGGDDASDGDTLTTGAEDGNDGEDEQEESPLPFLLEAPKYVFVDRVSSNAADQEINVAFSKNDSMRKYLSLPQSEALLAINTNGLASLKVTAQIDWAIDDPEAWHYDETWDNEGKGKDGKTKLGDWAYINLELTGDRQQFVRVFKKFGDPADKKNTSWNGSGQIKGWKDILPSALLKKGSDGEYYVDWTAHTLYVRVRYLVITQDNDEGFAKNVYMSDWSQTEAVGKGIDVYAPYVMESDLPVPKISNLSVETMSEEVGPEITFDVAIDEDFEKRALHTEVFGGVGHLVYTVRVNTDGEWKVVYRDAVSEQVRIPVKDVLAEGQEYEEGNPVEVYSFAWIDQYDGIGGMWIGCLGGGFSETLKLGVSSQDPDPLQTPTEPVTPTPTVTPTEQVTPEPTATQAPTETIPETVSNETNDDKVCPLCHLDIDPQFMGYCMFIWLGGVVVLLIIIAIIVKIVQKKRDEKTDILFR